MKQSSATREFFGTDWAAVTPSDTVNLPQIPKAIYVGGAGNIVLVSEKGSAATFLSVPAGTTLDLQPIRVNSTSTTATGIVAIY